MAPPAWVWDVKASRWDQGLRLLTAYAHRTGAPNPDSFYVEAAEGNFTLGAWAMSRRKEYRLGVLSPTRVAALGSDPRVGMESPRRRLAPHVYPPRTGRPPPRDRRPHHPNHQHRRSKHRSLGDGPTHPTPPRPPRPRPGPSPGSPNRLGLDTPRPPKGRQPHRTCRHQVTAHPRLPTVLGEIFDASTRRPLRRGRMLNYRVLALRRGACGGGWR